MEGYSSEIMERWNIEGGREEMGVSTAKQWSSIVKEGWNRAFLTAKFFCLLHVSNTYLYTVALVSNPPPPQSFHFCRTMGFLFSNTLLCVQAYGPSMLPTLNLSGDLVLADRLSVRFDRVRPGDIVLVRSPLNPRKIIMKRVLGMGGDRVTFYLDPENSHRCETVVVWTPIWVFYSSSFFIILNWWGFGVGCIVDVANFISLYRFRRGMFGLREITHALQLIQGSLVQFLMVCFRAECSGGFVFFYLLTSFQNPFLLE